MKPLTTILLVLIVGLIYYVATQGQILHYQEERFIQLSTDLVDIINKVNKLNCGGSRGFNI